MIRYPTQGYLTLEELPESKAFVRNMLQVMNAFNEDLERKRNKPFPRYYLVTREYDDDGDLFYFEIKKVERKEDDDGDKI